MWLLKPVPPQNPVTADDGDMLRPFAGPGRCLQADVVDQASSPRAVQFHLEEAASSGTLLKGKAQTQSPIIKNYASELPTFGVIVGVNPIEVQ